MNFNKVLVAGNLTRDPETRNLDGGRTVCAFGIAINRKWRGPDGQMKEEVTFVDCEAWGRTAENIKKYFSKGKPIFVEGRLKLDQWTDQQSGQKRSKTRVVAERFRFCGDRDGAQGGAGHPQSGGSDQIHEDDIPF